jgi:NADH-quinone oxidoreductase subunit E
VRPSETDLATLTRGAEGQGRALIRVLQDVQARFGWLPPEALEHVSRTLGVPLARVFGVATFYGSFRLSPRGRHICTVCLGTACHVRGGTAILEHFERKLGVQAGRTTADGRVTLERVNCLGACALAPLAVVDGRAHGRMTEAGTDAVLAALDKDDAA